VRSAFRNDGDGELARFSGFVAADEQHGKRECENGGGFHNEVDEDYGF
jgi:hypothetical protein